MTQTKIKLTPMETSVIKLMAQGYDASETARELYVSKRTVDFHLANIYDKCKTRSLLKSLHALGFSVNAPEDL